MVKSTCFASMLRLRPQVDKNNAAMVADRVDPAGNTDCFACIGKTELAAGMGSEIVHTFLLSIAVYFLDIHIFIL